MNVMVEIEKDEVVVTIEKDYKRFSDVSTSHGFVRTPGDSLHVKVMATVVIIES